jgi:hypothetical protein
MLGRGEVLGDMGLEPKTSPLPIIGRATYRIAADARIAIAN